MDNFLEISNVCKRFSNHVALDNVSMDIPRGKVFGLLGRNGAGKTTLIRIVNHITMADSGTVMFDGHPLCEQDVYNIGYLPEERGLYKKMKVGEQAIYLARLKGLSAIEAKKRLTEWFEKFDIMPWWNRKLEELSKGMQQKIQFIITILHRPQLLIFDEPFSGFDPENVELLKREMLELRNQGSTILFSTHNMASVEEICDNIALINHSKVVLRGEVDDIKNRYKDNTYNLTIPSDAVLSDVEVISQEQKGQKLNLIVRKPAEETNSQFVSRLAGQVEILSFAERMPSMNEVFLRVVGNDEIR
ncbi:MAG: ATP-binding cassette domain-containing protein [Bacteroidaceae bacterium]|jgi:ABC-2 type transport system ATP-binding protein|nr:ATP-binding cassette domain-containing protein [Bacteroidaceae bacterium]HAE24253.1 ABC transporter ATP-binding protein [Prevotellaceae bacterium]